MSTMPQDYPEEFEKAATRRFSLQTIKVVDCLIENGEMHGYGIRQKTKLKGGTVYPILKRLQKQGLLNNYWDMNNNPPRQMYQIPEGNIAIFEKEIENALIELAFLREDDDDDS